MKFNLPVSFISLCLCSFFIFSSSCRNVPQQNDTVEKIVPGVPAISDVVMYEIFVHNFSKEGTLNAVTARLDEIKDLGVNTIWLMPIQPIGQLNKKGTYGSPYSISDYYAINPDIGTKADFKRLVDSVHAKGMYIMIDEVANHTSWDNAWIKDHPDWYTKDAEGKIVSPVADWTDVADLNYDNAELRKEMIRSMKYWVDSFNIDGYRCDASGMVPNDWWKECITELRKIRPLMMLAESADSMMYQNGFDMTYPWDMYHKVRDLWEGKSSVASFDSMLIKEKSSYPSIYRPIRFIDNHDENSWDRIPLVKFQGIAGSKAAFALMMTLRGVPLVYQGQEVGYDTSINLFEKYNIDWTANPELRNFYKNMLHFYSANEVLKEGSINPVITDNKAVVMYTRTLNDTMMVVMVNATGKAVKAELPNELMSRNYSNALTNEREAISYDQNFAPYEYRILRALPPE